MTPKEAHGIGLSIYYVFEGRRIAKLVPAELDARFRVVEVYDHSISAWARLCIGLDVIMLEHGWLFFVNEVIIASPLELLAEQSE